METDELIENLKNASSGDSRDALIACIEKAIADERGAIEFYMKLVDSLKSPIIMEVIHIISVDEMKHLHLFEDMLDSLKSGKCTIG